MRTEWYWEKAGVKKKAQTERGLGKVRREGRDVWGKDRITFTKGTIKHALV